MRIAALCGVLLLACPAGADAQITTDTAGVRQAVLDYVEGFYQGDTTRLARALLPEMHKFGYYIPDSATAYTGEPMSYAEAMAFANRVRERNRPAPATAPKEIEIFDVLDQTASAKLTAWWGTDYLLLAKYGGQWKIVHILWQTPVPRR